MDLPEGVRFKMEVIDTWKMTVTSLPGTVGGKCVLKLPGKPFMAVRMTKVN